MRRIHQQLGNQNQQQLSDNGETQILQLIPTTTDWHAVFANDDGGVFTNTVGAFALVVQSGITSVVPLASDGRELVPCTDAENYLGLVENEDDAQALSHRATSYANYAKRFGSRSNIAHQRGDANIGGSGRGVAGYDPSIGSSLKQQMRPEVS